jgi:phage tail-like protein
MDANGQRFWQLADRGSFRSTDVAWDTARRRLRLANERASISIVEDPAEASARLARVPLSRDGFGNVARAVGPDVIVRSVLGDDAARSSGTAPVTDLGIGGDGILAVADGARLVLIDLRDRFADLVLTHPALLPWRIAPRAGGAWVLGVDRRSLGWWGGEAWRDRPPVLPSPGTFRPEPENLDPPRLVSVPLTLVAGEELVAIASSPDGGAIVLSWVADAARARLFDPVGRPRGVVPLNGITRPFAVAALNATQIAVLLAPASSGPVPEALVYDLSDPELLRDGADASGDFWPLVAWDGGPFAHALPGDLHYPVSSTATRPLHRLSLPSLRARGVVYAVPIDSNEDATVWHRLFLEADVPEGTGLLVDAIASDSAEPPAAWETERRVLSNELASASWDAFPGSPHLLGEVGSEVGPLVPEGDPLPPQRVFPEGDARGLAPRFAWHRAPSELPFHPGLLGCTPAEDRSGLFGVLLQRAGGVTRSLRGRYLHLRIQFVGNGRTTPEIAAIRAWGSRFSYVEQYLPELYHETTFGPDAAAGSATQPAAATRPDFLARFIATFESVLTPLEDQIASAWQLTDPRTAPSDALGWLAGWLGMTLEPEWDDRVRRRLIGLAPRLAATRGTVAGLALAIDAVTEGAVTRGEVVLVEDWRLRRTFATLLGVDLANEEDPLLGGVVHSGNSIVGDTLILGEVESKELLALFDVSTRTAAEKKAVDAFYRRLAFRLSLLVHRDLPEVTLRRIRRIAAQLVPAHVAWKLLPASQGLIVGLASLVAVDTWLGQRPQAAGVRLDQTVLGRGDRLARPLSLDPRLEGGTGS